MRLHAKRPSSLKPCAIGRSQVEESNERDPDTENRKSSDNTLRGPAAEGSIVHLWTLAWSLVRCGI